MAENEETCISSCANEQTLGTLPPMRRKKQALSQAEAQRMLEAHRATSGVLALNDPELGAPYAVPLSYVYLPGKGPELGSVYFHGSRKGRKVELMGADSRATFCVIVADDVVPETFSTRYRSVIAAGHMEIVVDDAERRCALEALGHAYAPLLPASATNEEIDGSFAHTCVFCLRIEQIAAKESKALAAERAAAQKAAE